MAEFDSMKFSALEKQDIQKIMDDPDFPYNNISLYLLLASEAYRKQFKESKENPKRLAYWKEEQKKMIELLRVIGKVHQDARISWKG